MAQAAFEIHATPVRRTKATAQAGSPSPAMRGIVFAVLLSLPIWAVLGYVAFLLP
jgi:hypothetical protein